MKYLRTIQYSINTGNKKQYYGITGTGIELEIKQNDTEIMQVIEPGSYVVDDQLIELQKLNISIFQLTYDKNKIYFRLGDNMTIEEFNQIISYIQKVTNSTENDIIQHFCRFLNTTEDKLFDILKNVNQGLFLGLSHKEQDFKICINTKELDKLVIDNANQV